MTTNAYSLPDIDRADARTVLASKWMVDPPERQLPATEASLRTWQESPWPTAELLSYTMLTGADGVSVLHFSQWTSDDAYGKFWQAQRQPRVDRIDSIVDGGIARLGVIRYSLYRSARATVPVDPGYVSALLLPTDGPDAARSWVDAVHRAVDGGRKLPQGELAAHFHVSRDGNRVLIYSEWIDEEAYRGALAGGPESLGGQGPDWREVRAVQGIDADRGERYHLHSSLARP